MEVKRNRPTCRPTVLQMRVSGCFRPTNLQSYKKTAHPTASYKFPTVLQIVYTIIIISKYLIINYLCVLFFKMTIFENYNL